MFIMISLHLLREKIVSEHLVVVQCTVRRDISIGCVPMALYYGHYGNDPILLLFPVVVVSDWEAASSCSQPACLPGNIVKAHQRPLPWLNAAPSPRRSAGKDAKPSDELRQRTRRVTTTSLSGGPPP